MLEFKKSKVLPGFTVPVDTTIVMGPDFVSGTRYDGGRLMVVTVELGSTINDAISKTNMLTELDMDTFRLLSGVCSRELEATK